MHAFYELYPVLSYVLLAAASAGVALVLWGITDVRRRDRDAGRQVALDDLLRTSHRR